MIADEALAARDALVVVRADCNSPAYYQLRILDVLLVDVLIYLVGGI